MKSLRYIKSIIEHQLAENKYKLYDCSSQLENTENILEYMNDSSKSSEYKDEKLIKDLSVFESYLSLKHQELEDEVKQLAMDDTFIVFNENNKVFSLNSKYSYEDLYSFINRYLEYFSNEDLMDIFLIVKHIKMNQIIEQAEKELPQENQIKIEESKIEIEDVSNEESNLDEEFISELSKCISDEELLETETQEEQASEKKILYQKGVIEYFYSKVADDLINDDKQEIDKDKFIEECYQLITVAHANCKDFSVSDLYRFFNQDKNREIFNSYKEANDFDGFKSWIMFSLPYYSDCVSFRFFDLVIKNIDICNKFEDSYNDLTSLNNEAEVDDFYPLFKDESRLNNRYFMSQIKFDFVKTKVFEDEVIDDDYGERKNIIFYTPESVKNTSDEKLLDPMKKMVSSLSQCNFEQIISKYEPSQINTCGSAQNDAFPVSKYMDGLAWEYRLEGTIRAICSRDSIFPENKQRLMNYYRVRDMEIMSIHNIFDSNHGGNKNGSLPLGQYGYTPYCNQIEFYEILTKEEAWTDKEFDYICMVADFCSGISESIIKSDNKSSSKKLIKELSNELKTVLMNYTQLNEIGGNKNGR